MTEERTTNDIWKELGKTYTQLGDLLDELNRLENKENEK